MKLKDSCNKVSTYFVWESLMEDGDISPEDFLKSELDAIQVNTAITIVKTFVSKLYSENLIEDL